MNIRVTALQVSQTEPMRFVTEASTLGIPPGQWPAEIQTDLGNGMPFQLQRAEGDGRLYKQVWGCITLVVLND